MEIKISDYIIVDKHNESLEDVLRRGDLRLIFKFLDDKTIEILEWNRYEKGIEEKYGQYYGDTEEPFIEVSDGGRCKEKYLGMNFEFFLSWKDRNTQKNFYEVEKKYKSLFKRRIKNAYIYYYVSFENISFQKEYPSVNNLFNLQCMIDGKTKKNSLITHFYYKKYIKEKFYGKTIFYDELVYLINFVMSEFKKSGLNKYDYYFYTKQPLSDNPYMEYAYRIHCIPIKSEPIDSNWFYVLAFYISVLLDYYLKIDKDIKPCRPFYDKNIFHKDMDCYDIMDILTKMNM